MRPHFAGAFALIISLFWTPAIAGEDHDTHAGHAHGQHEHAHEEGHIEITNETAQEAGIVIAKATLRAIDEHITLNGRISPNRDTTVAVPARFSAVVSEMFVTWGQSVTKGQKLAVLDARTTNQSYTITAPASGIILQRNASRGDVVDSEVLFVIADLSDVWAEFHVFPSDLAQVSEGLPVHVKSLSSNDETTAPISLLMPTADAFSQTVMAVVRLPNDARIWKPGMTVEGDVHLAQQGEKVVAVALGAVQRIEGKSVVFVKEQEGYEPRTVMLGRRDDTHVEVLEGLKAGEHYASEGSFILKADLGKSEAEHAH